MGFPPRDEPGWVDLGHDCAYRWVVSSDTDQHIGILFGWTGPSGSWNTGSIPIGEPWRDGGPSWVLVSEEPLTLTPSILSDRGTEQIHGYITDGRWVPC